MLQGTVHHRKGQAAMLKLYDPSSVVLNPMGFSFSSEEQYFTAMNMSFVVSIEATGYYELQI